MIDTQAIKARCDAAMNGTWEVRREYGPYYGVRETHDVAICSNACLEDALFIAHAREDVPALLAEVERLRAELADDTFADRIVVDCHDPHHDSRYCSTCEARRDGIDAYREALLR